MTANTTTGIAMRIPKFTCILFAATMIAVGILGLISGDFPPIWGGVPAGMPGRLALVYLCAFVSLACGVGLLWKRTAIAACRTLLIYLAAWLLLFRMPYIVTAPSATDTWWGCGDTAVMVAAASVLYVWLAGDRSGQCLRFVTATNGLRIARVLFGLGLIPFGIAHFTYLARTVSLVPGWLPWHLAWAYFFGCTFIAAGVAVIMGVYARLAATLVALQLGLFTVLVWVPVVVAGPDASQWGEFVSSWVLTVAAVVDAAFGFRSGLIPA
ncbi:MAG: DoxX family membrane protein [Gemmatimonadales bacterium]